MAKLRIDNSFRPTRETEEPGRRSESTEGSAFGAFVLLLVASGIAVISFLIAQPDTDLKPHERVSDVSVR